MKERIGRRREGQHYGVLGGRHYKGVRQNWVGGSVTLPTLVTKIRRMGRVGKWDSKSRFIKNSRQAQFIISLNENGGWLQNHISGWCDIFNFSYSPDWLRDWSLFFAGGEGVGITGFFATSQHSPDSPPPPKEKIIIAFS